MDSLELFWLIIGKRARFPVFPLTGKQHETNNSGIFFIPEQKAQECETANHPV
jgi:hypothetical protein